MRWESEHEAARKLRDRSAQNMPCAYCGREMDPSDENLRPTRDHIWPKKIRSITEGRSGTLWCCAECNIRKGDMMPSEWLTALEA